jgi:hypothetical protein
MNLLRRFVALAVSSLCMTALPSGAQDLPPVPSKILPTPQAPTSLPARTHVSPITGRTIAIRVQPEAFDSDAEEAEVIARNKALPRGVPRPFEKRGAIKKATPAKAAAAKAAIAAAAAPAAANIPDSEFYPGSDRAAAKLSIADGTPETFDDVRDLIATLPSKSAMVNRTPRITTDPDSGRVAEENRNVRVRCWLYAASRENDNDYHLILGRAPGVTPETYMTMEVSGLPPTDADSFIPLFSARKSFNDFFGPDLPQSRYDFYDPPVPVIVEGSLFFDITHAHGTPPGPTSLRPNMPVIWEVHPVTRIEFEPTS